MYRKYSLVSFFLLKEFNSDNELLTTGTVANLHGITKPTKLPAYANVTVKLFCSTSLELVSLSPQNIRSSRNEKLLLTGTPAINN